MLRRILPLVAASILSTTAMGLAIASDLPSTTGHFNSEAAAKELTGWKDNKLKQSILDFIAKVTDKTSKDFVPVEDRIAVFDNDGTLMCEKPAYFQVIFARDSAVSRQGDHPEWKDDVAIKPFLSDNDEAISELHGHDATKLIAACQSGLCSEDLPPLADKWISDARHKKFDRPYMQLKYEPMVQLLTLLRANGFKTYICSGAGADFIRLYSNACYGIPPEQVIGSSLKREYIERDGRSFVVSRPVVQVYNVGPLKPVMIDAHIGRRPIIAVGNSDGDIEMLKYCTDRKGPSLGILLHHDDDAREFKYDGGAEKALKTASERAWTVVSMKDDFEKVFANNEIARDAGRKLMNVSSEKAVP